VNYFILVSILAMFVAQFAKVFTKYFLRREWDFTAMFATGGMPSSHTAFVTTLAVSLGLIEGFDSIYFAITFVFGMVIAHDSMGIRFEAGKHASVLNRIVDDINELLQTKEAQEEKLKDLLGHHPIEVIGGFLLGIVIALVAYYGFY
jgi:acid phosphatase family membrane protein YuiD